MADLSDEADARTASGSGASPTATEAPKAAPAAGDPLARLPVYVRSLLRVRVPVQVRLASKRQSIGQIVDLCAGSIITFAKTCDEMLELKAGGCNIAAGEAVKVGDKFGLRISSMTMPNERFQSVRPND
jgi:flagellar motor switch/type III secretory pathway protein FliN